MQVRRKKYKPIAKGVLLLLVIYVVAYIIDSAVGGYWMIPSRDGRVRFKSELGGLSMTVAIMWQPCFGHNSLGQTDWLGMLFEPLIILDRTWIHPTHYMIDDDFDVWLKQLPPSKVHPKNREEFIRWKAKQAVVGGASTGKI